MRTLSKNVRCPVCGNGAMLTLVECTDRRDPETGRIEFNCSVRHHCPDEPELHELWTADRPKS